MRHSSILLLVLATASVEVARAQPLTDKTYPTYKGLLAPRADETRWRAIRWRTSLWSAVVAGHQQKKPLLVWAMNGHPLGCT